MEKYINEHGKECFIGATADTPFSTEYFHEVLDYLPHASDYDKEIQVALHTNLGSITVLDRRTGFGGRDIETGYRDPKGKFWLASGGMDVRYAAVATLGEAISWIKRNANTCIGI